MGYRECSLIRSIRQLVHCKESWNVEAHTVILAVQIRMMMAHSGVISGVYEIHLSLVFLCLQLEEQLQNLSIRFVRRGLGKLRR